MKVSFVGSGNVATSLAIALFEEEVEIVNITSHQHYNAEILAHKTNAKACKLEELDKDVDAIFICVPDDHIAEISTRIKTIGCPHVHTSGSVSMNTLQSKEKGVFYPLQTLTKSIKTDFSEVPFLLETNDIPLEIILDKLASKLTNTIRFINSDIRKKYHLAAVFSNNFTNHILAHSEKICLENHLQYELLHPLIAKTFASALSFGASESQTGPAKRKDNHTISEHLTLLKDNKASQKLYKAITDSISNME